MIKIKRRLSEKEINEIVGRMVFVFYAGLFCGIFYIGIYNTNSVVLFVRDYLIVVLSIFIILYLSKPIFVKIFFKNANHQNRKNSRSKV